MAIDLGNTPVGTPPTVEESAQIRSVLGLGNVENIALSSWTGNDVITLSSSQIVDFDDSIVDVALSGATSIGSLLGPGETEKLVKWSNGGGLIGTSFKSTAATTNLELTPTGLKYTGLFGDQKLVLDSSASNQIVTFPDGTYTVATATTNQTIAGVKTFSTRPQSSAGGVPIDLELVTKKDTRDNWVDDMDNIYVRQYMGWEAGPWQVIGDSGSYAIEGDGKTGVRMIGGTGNAALSAQGGGIRYTDGSVTGSGLTLLSRTWDMKFLFRNLYDQYGSGNYNNAVCFYVALPSSNTFWFNKAYGLYHVPQPLSAWSSGATFLSGSRIDVGGIVQIASTGGTTGVSEPTWNTTVNGTTTDNTVVWKNLGPHTSNKWAMGYVDSLSSISLTDTLVPWVSGSTNRTLLRLRSDGTNIYGSVNGSNEVSFPKLTNTGGGPAIMTRGDRTISGNGNRIAGILFTFETTVA